MKTYQITFVSKIRVDVRASSLKDAELTAHTMMRQHSPKEYELHSIYDITTSAMQPDYHAARPVGVIMPEPPPPAGSGPIMGGAA